MCSLIIYKPLKDSPPICHHRHGSALLFKLEFSLRQYFLEIIAHVTQIAR